MIAYELYWIPAHVYSRQSHPSCARPKPWPISCTCSPSYSLSTHSTPLQLTLSISSSNRTKHTSYNYTRTSSPICAISSANPPTSPTSHYTTYLCRFWSRKPNNYYCSIKALLSLNHTPNSHYFHNRQPQFNCACNLSKPMTLCCPTCPSYSTYYTRELSMLVRICTGWGQGRNWVGCSSAMPTASTTSSTSMYDTTSMCARR